MKESVETITQCEIEQRQQQSQQLQNQKNDFKNFNNSVNKIQRKNIDIPHINKLPVKDVLKKIISSRDINNNDSEAEHENAFFVADLGEIYHQHICWRKLLPQKYTRAFL
ncbi:7208_t:CDS:2 [Entrophospora sp. SA101]|nr:7208_t:CDS:2 [Entrophospora sp. SA101]